MELQAVTWKYNGLHVILYITFVTLHAWHDTDLIILPNIYQHAKNKSMVAVGLGFDIAMLVVLVKLM